MHQIASLALGVYLVVTSIVHFVAPARVQTLVPDWWPAQRATVYLSGLAELVLGVALLVPATRTASGLAATVMFVAYTGVHADGARHASTATSRYGSLPGVVVRCIVNVCYAAWALYAALGG